MNLDFNVWLNAVKLVTEMFADNKSLQYKNTLNNNPVWRPLTKNGENFIWVIKNNIDIRYTPQIPQP